MSRPLDPFPGNPLAGLLVLEKFAEFLRDNPEFGGVDLEEDGGLVFFYKGSYEPFTKEEFVRESPTREAMEKLWKDLGGE